MKKRKFIPILLLGMSLFTLSSCLEQGEQGIQGEKGDPGTNGKDGVSVSSITKTSSEGNVDAYTITYSDGTTSTFTVTNGEDGEDGAQGIQGEKGADGHTPIITIGSNGNWYIDGVDSGVSATGATGAQGEKGDKGEKGDPGEDGKDGENAPHYGETHTVTYHLNGGTMPTGIEESITVDWGDCLDLPEPTYGKNTFLGWYYESSNVNNPTRQWYETDAIFTDIDLYAHWDMIEFTITLDADGGTFSGDSSFKVLYNESYSLPTDVSKDDSEFIGWKDKDGSIWANEGIYTLKEDVTLTAFYGVEGYYATGPSFMVNGVSVTSGGDDIAKMSATSVDEVAKLDEDVGSILQKRDVKALYLLSGIEVGKASIGYTSKGYDAIGNLVEGDMSLVLMFCSAIKYEIKDKSGITTKTDLTNGYTNYTYYKTLGESLTPTTLWVAGHNSEPDENGLNYDSYSLVVAGAGTYTGILALYNTEYEGSCCGLGMIQTEADPDGQQVTIVS